MSLQEEYHSKREEFRKQQLEEHKEKIIEFIEYCKLRELNLTLSDFDYTMKIGGMAVLENIVYLLNKDIILDKDGLVNVNDLCTKYNFNNMGNGYFYNNHYKIMINNMLRLKFSKTNHYNQSLIDTIFEVGKNNLLYIALDSDRIDICVEDTFYSEKAYNYGVRFDMNISNLKTSAVLYKPETNIPPDIINMFFEDAYSLDIKWYLRNGVKTFQAYEFKTENTKINYKNKELYPVRYVHSEFDMQDNCFKHIDGSIHFFEKNDYFIRRDENFNYDYKLKNSIKPLSKKLFKVNGNISTKQWIKIVSDYFFQNPLIIEYFNGSYPRKILEVLEKNNISIN